jgi:DNA-binding NarL/FixJ family response regulator
MINLQGRGTRVSIEDRSDGKKLDQASVGATLGTLSERECQIAVLVSRGKGTKQIAGDLHISEHTVRSYMRRIFLKLGVSNRPAMVTQLLQTWRQRG